MLSKLCIISLPILKKTGIFNLGTGIAQSWNDLAQALFAALGRKTNIEYIEMPESLRPKIPVLYQAKP
jgi:ADP-L-glycero-D-manno-heptose 6-epimerase